MKEMKKTITFFALLLFAAMQGAYAQTEQNILQSRLDLLQKELNEILFRKIRLQLAEHTIQRKLSQYVEDIIYVRLSSTRIEDGLTRAQTYKTLLAIDEERIQRQQHELQYREYEIKILLEVLQRRQENVVRFEQTMLLTAQQVQEDVIIKKLLVSLKK